MSPLVTSSCGLVSPKADTWQLCGVSLGGPCCGMDRCEIGWALKLMVKSWPNKAAEIWIWSLPSWGLHTGTTTGCLDKCSASWAQRSSSHGGPAPFLPLAFPRPFRTRFYITLQCAMAEFIILQLNVS